MDRTAQVLNSNNGTTSTVSTTIDYLLLLMTGVCSRHQHDLSLHPECMPAYTMNILICSRPVASDEVDLPTLYRYTVIIY